MLQPKRTKFRKYQKSPNSLRPNDQLGETEMVKSFDNWKGKRRLGSRVATKIVAFIFSHQYRK